MTDKELQDSYHSLITQAKEILNDMQQELDKAQEFLDRMGK